MSFFIKRFFGRGTAQTPVSPELADERRLAQEFVDRGIVAEKSGAAEEALQHYRKASAADPQFAPAHMNLGIALQARGETAAAIESYRQAIALDSGYAAAHYNLALALLVSGEHSRAETEFRSALRLRPEFPEAWVGLADALEALQRDEEALAALDAAIAQREDYVGAISNAGALLRKMGRLEEADARFRSIPGDHPDSVSQALVFNRTFHNNNRVFYTLSPALLPAIVQAFHLLKSESPHLLASGGYYEFGLFKGFSFWFAEAVSREIRGAKFRFLGFDSFEGLPQTEVDRNVWWEKGNYAASLDEVLANLSQNGMRLGDVVLTKGFFSRELFGNFEREHGAIVPAIMVIDSDIYESCALILEHFGPWLVPGSILLLDDFNAFEKSDDHGERRALREFGERNPRFRTEHVFSFGWHGEAFRVTQGAGH